MKRANRIRKSRDFQRVRREGKSLSRAQVVYISRAGQQDNVRVGVSAGRRLGNAVQRNRAKRLLRAAMRPLIERIKPGREIVLLARKPIMQASSARLQVIIEGLAQEAGDLIQE